MARPNYSIRRSGPGDLAAVGELLRASYPVLTKTAYEPAALEPALKLMTRANPELLASGTFFVAELADGTLAGCGGWTRARPGDGLTREAVGHVRHFAVHPDWIRRGIGTAIFRACEADARAAGIGELECYATLNAERFYAALGFERVALIDVELAPTVSLAGCRMRRRL